MFEEEIVKYICLGYVDEKKWETMSESERNVLMGERTEAGQPLRLKKL